MKPKKANAGGPLDECYTPGYAVEALCTFLKPGATIWEPAAGSGRLATHLAQRGFRVLTSSLNDGQDFLTTTPSEPFDYIITNPPYSNKDGFVQRCQSFGVPYALLVPVETTGSGRILSCYPDGDYEELLFTRRIHFEMPEKGDPLVFKPGDVLYEWQWGDPVSKVVIEDGKKKTYTWIKHQAQFPVKWLGEGIIGKPRHIAEVCYACDLYLNPPRHVVRPIQTQGQLSLPIAA